MLFQTLLGHPLCMALVRYKWNSFGKYIYFITLFLFAIFVVFLTYFLIQSPAPYHAQQILSLCQNATMSDDE